MAKEQKITGYRLSENNKLGIYHQEAIFRAWKLHATGTYHGKERNGMELLKAYNKSPLVTLSQKGSENTIASMWTWQKHNQFSDLVKTGACCKQISSRHVYELDALTTVQVMARQAYIHQEGTKSKLYMARTIA